MTRVHGDLCDDYPASCRRVGLCGRLQVVSGGGLPAAWPPSLLNCPCAPMPLARETAASSKGVRYASCGCCCCSFFPFRRYDVRGSDASLTPRLVACHYFRDCVDAAFCLSSLLILCTSCIDRSVPGSLDHPLLGTADLFRVRYSSVSQLAFKTASWFHLAERCHIARHRPRWAFQNPQSSLVARRSTERKIREGSRLGEHTTGDFQQASISSLPYYCSCGVFAVDLLLLSTTRMDLASI